MTPHGFTVLLAGCWDSCQKSTWFASLRRLSTTRIFILAIDNSKQSRLRHLKKSVLKGPLLASLLFNTYFYDLPASEYAYADGLALIHAAENWQALETVPSQDMIMPSTYLMKWRLKLLTIDFDVHRKAKQKWYR